MKKKRVPKITQHKIPDWKPLETDIKYIIALKKNILKPGQFVVNSRTPIDEDQPYNLIDTTYQKCYGKKLKDFLNNSMKTRVAFAEMMKVPKLLGLFKCMDKSCTKIFDKIDLFKSHMKVHFSSAEKKNSNY